MKRTVPLRITLLLLIAGTTQAQIVTPTINANFGVDADLKANYFNGAVLSGSDDWFNDGTAGTGIFIIDTSGAAAIASQYIIDPSLRKVSFIRGMQYPVYSTVNGKLLYDAMYVRDHYKNDSTSFTTSNKNGQSPVIWTGGVSPVPDKNDINDMMLHVRRDGPSLSDSLWLFAGLSLHGNTGNRYFDFELYQSDIYYDKTDNQFHNYGNEAGHTAWQFDVTGNVTKPGDVILTAEFGSSSLTSLEARIWVHRSALLLTPVQFSWGGAFDGDGAAALYGYATIVPKTAGIFYGGNQCGDNTWAGPFGFVDVTNAFSVNYSSHHFMEVAVNMTKIGLDPYTILGSSCNLSFKKVFAKTRSSTSFTSDLKDFVGPYAIATPPAAVAAADLTIFCGSGAGNFPLSVSNPLSTSIYTWTSTDGHIISSPATGPTILADQAGSYVVTQKLNSACSVYATDTITIIKDAQRCQVLATENTRFSAVNNYPSILLSWTSSGKDIMRFEVERSINGYTFEAAGTANAITGSEKEHSYGITDKVGNLYSKLIYYRLKIVKTDLKFSYSSTVVIKNEKLSAAQFVISPNPASEQLQVSFKQSFKTRISITIYNSMGSKVQSQVLKSENEKVNISNLTPGIYFVSADSEGAIIARQKLIVGR
jgi:hypothetical protein